MEVLANMLEAIQDVVRLVGPSLLTLDQLQQAFDRFKAVLHDSAKRRKDRSNITSGEDFDEDEAEALEVCFQNGFNFVNSSKQTQLAHFLDALVLLVEDPLLHIGALLHFTT